MGIYVTAEYEYGMNNQGTPILKEIKNTGYGEHVVRVFELAAEIRDRFTCFCCSCGDGGSDAACRNHGFAAQRPCSLHEMPGKPWGEEVCGNPYLHHIVKDEEHLSKCDEGKMPEPVNPIAVGESVEPGELQL